MSDVSSNNSAKLFPSEFAEEPQFHRSVNVYDDGKPWNGEILLQQQPKCPQSPINIHSCQFIVRNGEEGYRNMRPSSSLSIRDNRSLIRNPNRTLIRKPLSSGYYSDYVYDCESPNLTTECYETQNSLYRGLREPNNPVMNDSFFSDKCGIGRPVMNPPYRSARDESVFIDDIENHQQQYVPYSSDYSSNERFPADMSYTPVGAVYSQPRQFSSSPRTPLFSYDEHLLREGYYPSPPRDFAMNAPSDTNYYNLDTPGIKSQRQDILPTSGKITTRKGAKKPQKCKRVLPPGETNPHAIPGGKLCFEYMNTGKCHRMDQGSVCRYRHLLANHPDAIADRFKSGLLDSETIAKYQLRPCDEGETNPFAPRNAPICFEYLNCGVCSRTEAMCICRYRHLLPTHPDAIADRERCL